MIHEQTKKTGMFSAEWAQRMARKEAESGVDILIGNPADDTDDTPTSDQPST